MEADSVFVPKKAETDKTDLVFDCVDDNQANAMQVEDSVAKMVVENNEPQHAATSFVLVTIDEKDEKVDLLEAV